ncbi:MAG: Holliday junction resolvase RuvX [Planctomycetota bacterium]|nr:MAG: Holliday junction resolvase RuvX [Planctomycetota bacterium]
MKGRVLAVDYGGRRTGLAVSDPLRIVASPLPPIDSRSLEETVAAVAAVVREREVRVVVVGMPYLPSGLEGEQCARVRLFLSSLREALPEGVAVESLDERFTTREAERLLRPTGRRRRELKEHIDSTAAVVLLRDYLGSGGVD